MKEGEWEGEEGEEEGEGPERIERMLWRCRAEVLSRAIAYRLTESRRKEATAVDLNASAPLALPSWKDASRSVGERQNDKKGFGGADELFAHFVCRSSLLQCNAPQHDASLPFFVSSMFCEKRESSCRHSRSTCRGDSRRLCFCFVFSLLFFCSLSSMSLHSVLVFYPAFIFLYFFCLYPFCSCFLSVPCLIT